MSTWQPQATEAVPIPREVLSIDEAMDRYAGEWVLMHVTRHDEDGWPSHGWVTVHAATQQAILDKMEKSPNDPERGHYVGGYWFKADRSLYIDDPTEFRLFLDEWIASDDDVD